MDLLLETVREAIDDEFDIPEESIIDFIEEVTVIFSKSRDYGKYVSVLNTAADQIEAGNYQEPLQKLSSLAKMNDELITHLYPIVAYLSDKLESQ